MALWNRQYNEPGISPGIEALELPNFPLPTISAIDFEARKLVESSPVDLGTLQNRNDSKAITWLHIQGRATKAVLAALESSFG